MLYAALRRCCFAPNCLNSSEDVQLTGEAWFIQLTGCIMKTDVSIALLCYIVQSEIPYVQVQALCIHYEEAAVEMRKLMLISPSKEQLPYPFWDPNKWTESCQLGAGHKLVYLARGPQQPLQPVKVTQQYWCGSTWCMGRSQYCFWAASRGSSWSGCPKMAADLNGVSCSWDARLFRLGHNVFLDAVCCKASWARFRIIDASTRPSTTDAWSCK